MKKNLNFDTEAIKCKVIPFLDNGSIKLEKAAQNILDAKKGSEYSDLGSVHNRIEKIKADVQKIKKNILDIANRYDEVERKNDAFLRAIALDVGLYNKPQTSFSHNSNYGKFEPNDNIPYITGFYTSLNGKRFAVYFQQYSDENIRRADFLGVNWGKKCNRAAEAIILSRYLDLSVEELIELINKEHADGRVVASEEFFNEHGLERSENTR